jgi:hypothetical protein
VLFDVGVSHWLREAKGHVRQVQEEERWQRGHSQGRSLLDQGHGQVPAQVSLGLLHPPGRQGASSRFAPRFSRSLSLQKWGAEKISDSFREEVGRLRAEDQRRVWELFEGHDEQVVAPPEGVEKKRDAEGEEEEGEGPTKKRKAARAIEDVEADGKGKVSANK